MIRASFALKTLSAALIFAVAGMACAADATVTTYAKPDFKGEACPPPQMLATGWYIGLQLGYETYRVRNSVNNPGAPAVPSLVSNPVLAAKGWVGGMLLGYDYMITDLFTIGAEIFMNASNADQFFSVAPGNTYNYKVKINPAYGIGILPGIKVTDSTLAYIRLGWDKANIKVSENRLTVPGANKRYTSNAFTFGFGLETVTYGDWSLRGEYDHMWYGSFTTPAPYSTNVSPSDNQFMLAMIYHFA